MVVVCRSRSNSRLHIAPTTSHIIFDPSAQSVEGIRNGNVGVFVPMVCRRRAPSVDLPTAHRKSDVYFEAIAVMATFFGFLDYDVAGENVTGKTLKMPSVIENMRVQGF
jgi:hypothetical protein